MVGPRPRVVVVGGGFAGRRAARLLQASGAVDVTLLDANGFFEYTPSALRCCVQPSHAACTVLPQPRGTRRAALVALELAPPAAAGDADAARSVTALLLSDGSRLACDFVLLATGSSYSPPIKAPPVPAPAPAALDGEAAAAARRAHYRAVCVRLEAAQCVLIVGGGTVGVELAAEVVAKYGRRKPVTLVARTLLERMPPAAGRAAERWLRAAGVTLMLGARVKDWGGASDASWGAPGDWTLTTDDGETLRAGAVFRCAGGAANAPYLKAVPGALRADGSIAVTPTLRVAPLTNVFAAGDAAGHGAEATALSADMSADVAARNLLALAALLPRPGGALPPRLPPLARFAPPSEQPRIAAVSLGPHNGVMQFNSLVLSGPLVAALKRVIEQLQLGTARGSAAHTRVWSAIEATNVFLGERLFRGGLEAVGAPA
jgi:NADH dehydrogenase FAD-containing subunit